MTVKSPTIEEAEVAESPYPENSESPFVLPRRYATIGSQAQLSLKRALDMVGSLLGLLLLSPALASIAVAIRLDSAGPILYRWRVVGRGGRYFTGYKFRTMVPNAEARRASWTANE